MDNLIGGTEALRLLGIKNDKKGSTSDRLARHGIKPVFSKGYGRGNIILCSRADVEEAKKEIEKNKKDKAEKLERLIANGKPTRFVPTVEALQVLNRLEEKIDALLAVWSPDHV